jgi:hypothetical protein
MTAIYRHLDYYLPTEVVDHIMSHTGGVNQLIAHLKEKYQQAIDIPVQFSESLDLSRVPEHWKYIDFHYPSFWNNIKMMDLSREERKEKHPELDFYYHGESELMPCKCCPNGAINPYEIIHQLIDKSMLHFAEEKEQEYEAAYVVIARNHDAVEQFNVLLKSNGADPVYPASRTADLAADLEVELDDATIDELAADIGNQTIVNIATEHDNQVANDALIELATEAAVNGAIGLGADVNAGVNVDVAEITQRQQDQMYFLDQDAKAAAEGKTFDLITDEFGHYNMSLITLDHYSMTTDFRIVLKVIETKLDESSVSFIADGENMVHVEFMMSNDHSEYRRRDQEWKRGDILITETGFNPSSRIHNIFDQSYEQLYSALVYSIHVTIRDFNSWISVVDLDFSITAMLDLIISTDRFLYA